MKELIDKGKAVRILREMKEKLKKWGRTDAELRFIDTAAENLEKLPAERPDAEMLTVEDIENGVIPTVIWLETVDDMLTAGVWVHDHYEFEDGTVDESPDEMEAYQKGMYGKKYRIWRTEPTEEERDERPWM